MPSILILEDEENLRLTIAKRLRAQADLVAEAGTLAEARALVKERVFDLVITDMNLPDGDGVELIREIDESGFGSDIIVITAYGTVEHAVDAMRHGASDYLEKPVRLDELAIVVGRTLEQRGVRARLAAYERADTTLAGAFAVVGEHPQWLAAVETAGRFAEANADPRCGGGALPTILVTGETGAGKGVLARLIHERAVGAAGRSSAPFVQVNCAALPTNLVESELFGHEKGAFTDAKQARAGFFELADGGTIFLDEIAEMSPEMQAKLLLVLENGMIRRVGGTTERCVAARVIAATNQDLQARVADGSFRQDLYYRLGSFVVPLPALRERGDDAVLLAEATLERLKRAHGRDSAHLSDAAVARVRTHAWPGNARELVNAVQRALIIARSDEIGPEDLAIAPAAAPAPAVGAAGGSGGFTFDFDRGPHTVEEVERELIQQALARCDGNVTQAARLVGMPRGSFRYRMEKAGLTGAGDGA